MAEHSIQTSLGIMRDQSARRIADLKAKLAAVSAEQDAIHQEVQLLRKQLTDLSEKQHRYQDQLDQLQAEDLLRREAEIVFAALASGYEAIRQQLEKSLALYEKCTNLLREQPALKTDIEEYSQVEKEKNKLDSLPDSYRNTMLKHHQDIEKRLEPFLAIRWEEKELWQRPLLLPVFIIPLANESQINWLIPLPSSQDLFPESIGDDLSDLLEILLNAILRISREPDWFFAGIDEEPLSWQGYWTLVTLMVYEGEESIIDYAQKLLPRHLSERAAESESALLKKLHFKVELAEFSAEAWGWSQTATLAEQSVFSTEKTILPLLERSQGWYKDEDVVSWERPLKVSEDSGWNEQARRLRTILINLVAEGKIGGDSVAAEILSQPLPAPHAEAMHQGLKVLVTQGVLSEAADGQITINPAMLAQVQNLINRDINEFWRQVVATTDLKNQDWGD